ncbi:hypothetical protein B7R54_02970 [Subtercola boreus]|uniref:Gram-positive cocci surface proteins LPxTG domain-containing protein n=1 Tax=Subtercola boreus TaxID=120213 RepID=A0A3E0VG02_9MICO|nr:hypothetical protein [Subtercola boreus]RFA08300.1 hypothetical protein B7R54_02970 [Subtercola boreus]TQL54800.1 hypothetical protein FB464_2346 [Subtercola boreus]
MTLRAPTPLSGLGRRALATLAVLGSFAFVGGVTAAPANAAAFDVFFASGNPDFGFAKAGTVQIKEFDIQNGGDDSIAIDPAPLTALTGPFTVTAGSFSALTVIPKNGHGTFKVNYTVPAVGTVSTVPVTLVVTDQADNTTKNLSITFKGTSIATDPAHFTATTSGGGTSADFGTVSVGSFATKDVTLTVDGVLPIRFSTDNITIVDSAGNPLPGVKVTASSFGTAGAVTNPGVTAAFELTYTPLAAGSVTGSARVSGFALSGSVETSAITVVVPLSGSAAAVTPTSPPATPPATPGATVTPLPTVTGTTTSTAAVVAPRPGTGTGSLAETGAPVAGIVGLGAIVGLLGFGALAGLAVTRRRRANNL